VNRSGLRIALIAAIAAHACTFAAAPQQERAAAAPEDKPIPANFFRVEPAPASANAPSAPPAPASELQIASTQFFSYALPQGWRVGEDGQFALTLHAPDNKAVTVMVGNAGYPLNYPPNQFVYEKLMALQPMNLQLSAPRQAAPASGFAQAYEFDVAYLVGGVPCRGLVKCHLAPSYDSAVMAMTAALSAADQWPGYSTWLPAVAEQVSATNGAAFGARGIMAQNLRNSTEYASAARQYREWSQRNWQQTTDERNASQDRINFHRRENLGGVNTYLNPYNSNVPLELPQTYQYYWVDRQGNVVGTNEQGADPNVGSTGDWRRMERHQP
jgi:hypothetical protein